MVSPDTCRPFSKDRSGMILGEGGAMLVLEPLERALARGARIYAEIVGFGMSADASHITQPSVRGRGPRHARRSARWRDSRRTQVGYINAHGTATQANDPTETAAIRSVFGAHADRLAVSSTKSMHGHALGAAGALEAVADRPGAARHGVLPPTANFHERRIRHCDLDVIPNQCPPSRSRVRAFELVRLRRPQRSAGVPGDILSVPLPIWIRRIASLWPVIAGWSARPFTETSLSAVSKNLIVRSRGELDRWTDPAVDAFFARERPEYVFLAAAKVGGVLANSAFPAEFLYENLVVQTKGIHSAYRHGVKKLQFLGSSCIYPRMAPQPIKEEYLLTGELEPTNEWYAIAKIAGLKMAQAYRRQYGFNAISLMPTNLYGPGDNFDLESSHVLPALLRKVHEAKLGGAPEVVVWGTGTPRREFLHVDDFAAAAVYLMSVYEDARIINVGAGVDLSVRELAETIGAVTGYCGRLVFDAAKPDGMPRKLLVCRG